DGGARTARLHHARPRRRRRRRSLARRDGAAQPPRARRRLARWCALVRRRALLRARRSLPLRLAWRAPHRARRSDRLVEVGLSLYGRLADRRAAPRGEGAFAGGARAAARRIAGAAWRAP